MVRISPGRHHKFLVILLVLAICPISLIFGYDKDGETEGDEKKDVEADGEKMMELAGYGESCSDKECDTSALLKCKANVCNCSRPDIMIFDKSTSSCYVMAGERCSPKTSGNKNSGISSAYTSVGELACVTNAACAEDGYCTCSIEFMEASNGTCIPKRSFRDSCDSDKQCRSDQGLRCINKRCTCDRKSFLMYNTLEQKCSTMAGYAPVNGDRNCVPNAALSTSYYPYRCRCDSNYIQSENGLCLVPYGGTCQHPHKLCESDKICKNGECRCRFGGQRHENGNCVSRAGQPCEVKTRMESDEYMAVNIVTEIRQTYNCTLNSVCRARKDNRDVYECQCNDGFVQANGQCQLEFGKRCSVRDDQECDEASRLVCINGVCNCPVDELQYYDEKGKACKGLVGAFCGVKGELPGFAESFNDDFCTEGAVCAPSRKYIGSTERFYPWISKRYCECGKGYKITVNRKCSKVSGDASVPVSTSEPVDSTTKEAIPLK